MKQRLAKVISSMLVVAILYANSAAVISYAADSLLSDKELENQKTQTNNSNVEFDAYYEGGKHKAYSDINSSDTKLNLELNVKDAGYLKDITVSFAGSNFNIVDDGSNADKIQRFDSENKVIAFNQIDAGNTVVKKLTIVADKSDVVSEDVLGKDNDIVLNAVYVNKDGKEIAINKAIKLNASWKTDDAKAKLSYEITKYIPYSVGNTNKIITQAKVTSGVQDSVLPIKETNIEIVAPKINNENPESITVVANSTIATNGEEKAESFGQDNYSYDSTTGLIKINVKNDAKDGKIAWSKNTLDEYVITYVLEHAEDEMKFLDQFVEKGLIDKLTKLIHSKFTRITHEDVITLLKEAEAKGTKWEFKPEYGEDIAKEHEKYITEYFNGPVFITDWPKDIKSFYMN